MIYRGIKYKIVDNKFVHFYNPKGKHGHREKGEQVNQYGRDAMIRTIPKECALSFQAFAKTVIDHLYTRMETAKKEELRKRLYY
jgi:hypothetical protein